VPHLRLRILHVSPDHLQPGRVRSAQTPVVAKNSIGHKERIIHASVEGPKELLN